jgi:hypothetical protein
MTLVSVNKLKKEGYIWDMNQNVLIQQKDDKKVCNIDEHYGLPIIEFNPVSIKKTNVVPIQKEDDPAIKTSHNDQIVTSGGEDEMSVQANGEKDDPVQANLKNDESVPVNFKDKISSHVTMNSVNSHSDWLKDAPDDLI